MAQPTETARTIPVVPPGVLPMKTMRTVRNERRRGALGRFIVVASDESGYRRG